MGGRRSFPSRVASGTLAILTIISAPAAQYWRCSADWCLRRQDTTPSARTCQMRAGELGYKAVFALHLPQHDFLGGKGQSVRGKRDIF